AVNDHVTHHLHFIGRERLAFALRAFRSCGRRIRRRDLDRLARLNTVTGGRRLPVELQLAGARPTRDDIEADVGHVPLEPAVQAYTVVVLVDFEGSEIAHAGALSEC